MPHFSGEVERGEWEWSRDFRGLGGGVGVNIFQGVEG